MPIRNVALKSVGNQEGRAWVDHSTNTGAPTLHTNNTLDVVVEGTWQGGEAAIKELNHFEFGVGAPANLDQFRVTAGINNYDGTYNTATTDEWESTVVLNAVGDTFELTVKGVLNSYLSQTYPATNRRISWDILPGPYQGTMGPVIFSTIGSEGTREVVDLMQTMTAAQVATAIAASVNTGVTDMQGVLIGGVLANADTITITIAGDAAPYVYTATVPADTKQTAAEALRDAINLGSATYTAQAVNVGGGDWGVIMTAVASGAAAAKVISSVAVGTVTTFDMYFQHGFDASALWTASVYPSTTVIFQLVATGPSVEDMTISDNGDPLATPAAPFENNKQIADGVAAYDDDATAVAAALVALHSPPTGFTISNIAGVITCTSTVAGLAGALGVISADDGGSTFVSVNTVPAADDDTELDIINEIAAAAVADPDYDITVVLGVLQAEAKVAGLAPSVVSSSTTSVGQTFITVQDAIGTDAVLADHAILDLDASTLVADYTVLPGDTIDDIALGLQALVDADANYTSALAVGSTFTVAPTIPTAALVGVDNSTSLGDGALALTPVATVVQPLTYNDGTVFDLRTLSGDVDLVCVLESGTSYKVTPHYLYTTPALAWVAGTKSAAIIGNTVVSVDPNAASFIYVELSDFVGGGVASVGLAGKEEVR